MNIIPKKYIASLILLLPLAALAEKTIGRTFFQQRSQGSDLAREWSGITQFIAPCDSDCLNGFLAITPAYSRNFNRDEIGAYFFFNGTNTMHFGAAGLPTTDVWARQMFLNDDFSGDVTILPRVENFMVDIRFRLNLDEWICGLYFDMYAPINWTRWDLNLDDSKKSSNGTEIAQFALGNAAAAPSPINSIKEAYFGQQLQTTTFTNLKEILNFGKINGAQTKTSLADITAALGYNFICNECMHLGIDVRAVFPTGTRPDSEFLFEPVVGNGKLFELGLGMNGHYEFWNNACDSSFSMWVVGFVNHMFKSRQRRIFDLNNPGTEVQNIGSHRLLIKRFTGGASAPQLAEIKFGPNVLAREMKVRNDVHSEILVMFDYQRCGFTLDFGYNFWVRTQDKISNIEPIAPETYALAGQTLGTGGASAIQTGSTAKINGTGGASDGVLITDNVYLTTEDLSIDSVTHPTAMTHKVFTHVQYAWDGCDYTPFIGMGGGVEFSGRDNNAFDQWEFWIKGGFGFY